MSPENAPTCFAAITTWSRSRLAFSGRRASATASTICWFPGVIPTPFSDALVAIGGSKFKVVNNRDRNFTANKIDRYREQMEACIERKTLSAQRN